MTEHISIDEGLPRKQISLHKAYRRNRETGRVEGVPVGLDPKAILEQYLSSKTTSQIAKQYGVKRNTLVTWLRGKCPKEWKQVQAVRALMLKEDGTEAVMDARHPFHLARAREMIASAQFDLERLDEDYAPKQQVTVEHNIRIDPALIGRAADLLDQMRDVTPTSNSGQIIDATQQPDETST